MSSTTRLLHCSDLHLVHSGESRDYGLSVFEEILEIARQESVSLILSAGDLFDSRRDFEALLPQVDTLLTERLEKVRMIMLPGNHEELVRSSAPLKSLSATRNVEISRELPFGHLVFDGFDLITVPFQNDYGGFEEWEVPPRNGRRRIVLAHGSVFGASVPEGLVEDRDSVLDDELFARFGADYVALGHIHQPSERVRDGTPIVYPGSSRVWRQGEVGPRGVYIIEVGEELSYYRKTLSSAGELREIAVLLGEGADESIAEASREWNPADWVHLRFFGLKESEEAAQKETEEHARRLSGRFRRVTVDKSDVLLVPEAEASPLVARFLSEWEKLGDTYRGTELEEAWEKARLLGLEKIARALG